MAKRSALAFLLAASSSDTTAVGLPLVIGVALGVLVPKRSARVFFLACSCAMGLKGVNSLSPLSLGKS